jgi:outer membrane protein
MTHTLRRVAGCGLAVLAIALAPRPLQSADAHFGYIDSARIFQEYPTAQEAQKRFDRQVQGWRDEAAEKEKSVKVLRDEVRDQGPILSSLKRQEKEEQLQRAISDYEHFIQDTWGPQGRAARENEQATTEVVVQIRAAVEKVAASRGLTIVLDSASGIIIYADRSLDLTSDVLTELNSTIKPGGTH